MRVECYNCHSKTVENLIIKHRPTPETADLFRAGVKCLFDKDDNNPTLATHIHRYAGNILNNSSLYREEKITANKLLMKSYSYWQQIVNENDNPFYMAAKLAVTGNIIDYGAHSVPEDIEKQIKVLLNQALAINHSWQLIQEVEKAKSILYLGDNAGEIVFDKLFIETMNHANVSYAVRGNAVINDVTVEDTKQTGIDKICKIISNGYDAPSTLLEHCSKEFIDIYNSADLIIAKGMGNFEGLMHTQNPKIFFMLMAKCNPIAKLLGVKKGDMVIRKNEGIKE